MNRRMLEILACPIDKHTPLELFESHAKAETVLDGAMYCTKCGRFYPIIEEIPIMLPDELRNKEQELDFVRKNKDSLPQKIIKDGKPWHL